MKKIILSSFLLLLLFTSCDPGYGIDYVIDNQSDGQIEVVLTRGGGMMNDTSIIGSNTQLFFDYDGGIGSARDRMENIQRIPLDTIQISTIDGLIYNKNSIDRDLWENIIVSETNYSSHGEVILTVIDDDFN